jgi:hypothetical protein
MVERGMFRDDDRLELQGASRQPARDRNWPRCRGSPGCVRARLSRQAGRAGRIYARAGIAEYWIVDVVGRGLEVHREPARLGGRRRWLYRNVQRLGPDAAGTPLAAPDARVAVADLLP